MQLFDFIESLEKLDLWKDLCHELILANFIAPKQ